VPPQTKHTLAQVCVPLSIGVTIYTEIMWGVMPAQKFWHSPALSELFVLSSRSFGIANFIFANVCFPRQRSGPAIHVYDDNSNDFLIALDALWWPVNWWSSSCSCCSVN